MKQVYKTPSGVIHQIAGCEVCDWRDETHTAASRRAKAHTKKSGHTTWVETGTTYYYKEQNNANSNETKT